MTIIVICSHALVDFKVDGYVKTYFLQTKSLGTFTGPALARASSCRRTQLLRYNGDQDRHQPSHDHSPNMAADACSAISIFLFVIAVAGFVAPALSELFLSARG
ncbi:hypothetical protein HBA92_20655 [Ochrobactrum sp. MR28]|nr:hypothetical protein [Ochrobactrum sp. MR28]MBX8818956.1 hypothetical protein [Ochrobactrum sp. MR31]